MTRLGRFSRLIVTASDGGSLLRSSVWDELLALDDAIYNMTVHYDGLDFRYNTTQYNTLHYSTIQ